MNKIIIELNDSDFYKLTELIRLRSGINELRGGTLPLLSLEEYCSAVLSKKIFDEHHRLISTLKGISL